MEAQVYEFEIPIPEGVGNLHIQGAVARWKTENPQSALKGVPVSIGKRYFVNGKLAGSEDHVKAQADSLAAYLKDSLALLSVPPVMVVEADTD